MTTIVIDCEKQTVYADSCTTTTKYTSYDKNTAGLLLTGFSEHENYEHRIERSISGKLHPTEGVVIVGAGDKRLIDRFKRNYGKDVPCKIDSSDGNATIYVVSKRPIGLLIDKYTIKQGKRKWWLKKTRIWNIESFVQTQGFISDGSGGDYAAGAMVSGKTGKEAIEIASTLCPYTDGNVQEVEL
ncbi:hypothetical protein [Sinomicrobium sp.]